MRVAEKGWTPEVHTPKLEKLVLHEMLDLKEIWSTESMQTSNKDGRASPRFHNLITIEVSRCDSLEFLLPYSTAKGLINLKHLEVNGCESMEQIIYETRTGVEETGDKSILPQLVDLVLSFLPELTSFCLGKYNFDWPNMIKVLFRECPKMKDFCFGLVHTPKLDRVYLDDNVDGNSSRHIWKGDLKSTIQYLSR